MAWINLLIAGMLEVFWAISLKYTHGSALAEYYNRCRHDRKFFTFSPKL